MVLRAALRLSCTFIQVIGAYRMDDQGLKGTKQRQKPHTSMGTHNGVRQQNSRTGSLATGASAHHQSPTLTGTIIIRV